MDEAVSRLLRLLELEDLGADVFRGPNLGTTGAGRLFGGQVASQSLRAAGHTIDPAFRVHSLHSYFLRPGRPGVPIEFAVDRIRDGRSFGTRRVVATQDGAAIFELSASFHVSEVGPEGQLDPPDAPDPELLPKSGARMPHHLVLDTREFGPLPGAARSVWVRTAGRLPDEPALHACAIRFLTDMGPVGAVRRLSSNSGTYDDERAMRASLDHVLWFHRPARADDWLLYNLEGVAAFGARGLARGLIHDRAGRLVTTVTQEALIRPI